MFSLFRENVRIAMESIKGQLLKTILTVFIIGMGILALVGSLTLVDILSGVISNDFESMGANTFTLQRYEFNAQRQRGGEREKVNPIINYNDVRGFIDAYEYPFSQTSVSFTGTRAAEVKFESEKTDPDVQVYGVNEHYLENTGTEVEFGRAFTVFDIANNSKVCVIGSDFKRSLFKNDDPLNKTISIRGVKFKIIGIMESKGSTFGNNQDLKVLVPIQVARGMYTQPNIDYRLSIKVDDKEVMEGAQEAAILTFRNIRKLSPLEKNNFGMVRSDDLVNRINDIKSFLTVAASIISIITILGSSIALMNILLVSVSQRTREIGVRKALGAKRSTIAVQFLMESVVIGQFGSILGILLGLLVGLAMANGFDIPFQVPWGAMIAATIVSFLVAVVAGLFPAVKAARLDPIESLRYE